MNSIENKSRKHSDLFLTGRDYSNITYVKAFDCELHLEVVKPLQKLSQLAASAGQCLQVVSGYRSFDRQLQLWNAKATGQRPVLDANEQVIDLSALSDWEKVQAILTWSALPGASRHHWGTDIDVFNPACLPKNYCLQLTQDEYLQGVQQEFNRWLSEYLDAGDREFFRPYHRFTGGISPEPWHISYRPLADHFQAAVTVDVLTAALEETDLVLKSTVLNHLDEIVRRYVRIN